MISRIGIVTGGGDCPGLNAVIGATAKAAIRRGYHGSPTNLDRALCTIFGAMAIELIAKKKFGQMVSFTGSQITSVPLSEATSELRRVPRDGGCGTAARSLGMCLGDLSRIV